MRGFVVDSKFGPGCDVSQPIVLTRIRHDAFAGKCVAVMNSRPRPHFVFSEGYLRLCCHRKLASSCSQTLDSGTPMWFAVVGRAKKSKLLRRGLARAGPCRVIVFFVLMTVKKTSVISGWSCGQQRIAPCCSQMFWDGWTRQCVTTKNIFIRRRPHHAQSCSSRDHTRPHSLSVNVRRFRRTHPLPWNGRLFTHRVKGNWYGSY